MPINTNYSGFSGYRLEMSVCDIIWPSNLIQAHTVTWSIIKIRYPKNHSSFIDTLLYDKQYFVLGSRCRYENFLWTLLFCILTVCITEQFTSYFDILSLETEDLVLGLDNWMLFGKTGNVEWISGCSYSIKSS